MRALILIAALALAACATTPPPTPVAASAKSGSAGAATLAVWGSWQWQIAPLYTTSATLRLRAAKQLEEGRITRGTAVAVQAACDRARAALDASWDNKREQKELAEMLADRKVRSEPPPTPEQLRLKAAAEQSLAAAQALLEP